MYFVDKEKITETLNFIENLVLDLESISLYGKLEKYALERICHLLLEGILDVGNSLIDAYIMRDPGSFEDIVLILIDEKVISDQCGRNIINLMHWRKMFTQDYISINEVELYSDFIRNKTVFSDFVRSTNEYLGKNTDVLTTFTNK
ncbi:MAG: hypothetical protein K0S51_2428 [Bacillales bacterium]|jgi:uncharacterized protein YutE (UPF0331/DUF86 family)|nr:hypothetical protein [Bacillales bacterium]